MLCDGRLVCGCADPYGKRVLGDVRTSGVSDIWTGERVATLRQEIIDQMTEDERRQYLSESLFLNFVSFENQKLAALMKKIRKDV